jgi:hypothetical protein
LLQLLARGFVLAKQGSGWHVINHSTAMVNDFLANLNLVFEQEQAATAATKVEAG